MSILGYSVATLDEFVGQELGVSDSKRNSIYVTVGHMFNERNATFTVDGGVLPPASTPLPGVDQTGVMVGVRHQF